MKTNKFLIKILILAVLIIICASNICIAGGDIDTSNLGQYRPGMNGSILGILNRISGVLIAVGILAVVVTIALIGFNMILGSASEKAVAKEKFGGVFIAALILTCGATIANFLINQVQNLF